MGLILALDTPDVQHASAVLAQVRNTISLLKVSHVLLASLSSTTLDTVIGETPLFLDLKWFDIPNTVDMAIQAYQKRFPQLQYFTFHGCSGDEMIGTAAKYASSALSVLSLSSESISEAEFLRLARRNIAKGIRGFICPGLFLGAMRREFGDTITLVTPGVRCDHSPNDHFFTTTAAQAAQWGATHIVVGRPILESPQPEKIATTYLSEFNQFSRNLA